MPRVSYKLLQTQAESTACWVSAAHYVLQYCKVAVHLSSLMASYYKGKAAAVAGAGTVTTTVAGTVTAGAQAVSVAAQMTGSGQPKTILAAYTKETGRVPVVLRVSDYSMDDLSARITASMEQDVPVIAAMYSRQLSGWVHAVLIIRIEQNKVAFKDPAQGDAEINRSKALFFKDGKKPGFLYKDDYVDKQTGLKGHIFAYCAFVTLYEKVRAAPKPAVAALAGSTSP